MFNFLKYGVEDVLESIDDFLGKFRFTLRLSFVFFEIGWFSGETLHLLKLRIYEGVDYHYFILFDLQILKFSIVISIEF